MSQFDLLAAYRPFLDQAGRIVRLGAREQITVARIIAAGELTRDELGDSLASALATDKDQWDQLRRCFEQFVPGGKSATGQLPAIPRQAPRRLAFRDVASVLTLLCVVAGLGGVSYWLGHEIPHQATTDQGHADLGPADGPPDGGCNRVLEPKESAPLEVTSLERPPLKPLDRDETLALLVLVWGLSALAVALLRLWPHLRAQRDRLEAQRQLAEAEEQAREEELSKQGATELARLQDEADRQGQPVRPRYRVPLAPPLPLEVLEDCAVLLGRVYRAVLGDEIDVPATLDATVAAGGDACVVMAPRRVARDLLVLYDESATRPYWPAFQQILDCWKRLGVNCQRYRFDREPGRLRRPGGQRAVALRDLARRYEGAAVIVFASRLQVRGKDDDLGWPLQMRDFVLRAWLDPDPRPQDDRNPEERAEIAAVERLLPRFPLTPGGLRSLGRYLVAEGVGVKLPPWEPLPQPAGDVVRRWVALGAQVPDAGWEQFEGLRQNLLSAEVTDARAMRWVIDALADELGDGFRPAVATVDPPDDVLKKLLRWLRENHPKLYDRGFQVLKEWLGAAAQGEEGKSFLYYEWKRRLFWYEAGLHPDKAQEILKELEGTAAHQAARDTLALVQAVAAPDGEMGMPAPRRLTLREARMPGLALRGVAWSLPIGLLLAVVPAAAVRFSWLGGLLGPPVEKVTITTERVPYYRIECTGEDWKKTQYRPALVAIPAGSFMMGSNDYDDEKPPHKVSITRPFLLMETEVTQGQYQAVMGKNPSQFKDGPDAAERPVEQVSWLDAVNYANQLSKKEGLVPCYETTGEDVKWDLGLACKGYRLPTEAEWEYAARAGQDTEYAGSNKPDEVAWYGGNSDKQTTNSVKQTHPAGQLKPNHWGLYDMSGNVYEWVWDWYKDDYYKDKEAQGKDPMGPKSGSNRVDRGGSWGYVPFYLRVANRVWRRPAVADDNLGFRLSRSHP